MHRSRFFIVPFSSTEAADRLSRIDINDDYAAFSQEFFRENEFDPTTATVRGSLYRRTQQYRLNFVFKYGLHLVLTRGMAETPTGSSTTLC